MIIAISITLFFIVLRFTVTLFNFISNPKLTRVNRTYDDFVSVLIPARNEEDNILTLLEALYCQDVYRNYEVIIYDDESSDRTYEICSEFAARHTIFSVIKGSGLPDGWVGKNYACYQLAKKAKGDYLLFLDADEIVIDDLINSGVHRMHLHKLSLLSVFPRQVGRSLGAGTVVPLLHYMLLNLLPLRLVYLVKNPAIATASGQCMLFDALVYGEHQWHERVKEMIEGDTEIMKLVKASSYNTEVLLANGMVSCLNTKSYRDTVGSFSKNVLAAFNYSIPGLLIYLLLLLGGPMIVIMTLNFSLIFFMAGLILLTRVMISLSAQENVWYNLLLHPIQMINMAVIAFLSIQKYLTKTIVWKGRRV
jgi:glycosyltransferase involved in cell wall biosynthesis